MTEHSGTTSARHTGGGARMAEPTGGHDSARLDSVIGAEVMPRVTEVVRFEDLPLGSRGRRRAVALWSDGSEGEALAWCADEIVICKGDLVGQTREPLRFLHFRRDRDWLES